MTLPELRAAVALASSDVAIFEDIEIFAGFALPDFGPVHVTIRHLAALIRWQCFCFNGSIDADALAEIEHFGRRRFVIV